MKKIFFGIIISLFLCSIFTSCSKDEASFEKKEIANLKLVEILKKKGFSFENNQLLINDKVTETKTLDLSGTGLNKIEGLAAFTNLEKVNLSNNDFESLESLSGLPSTIMNVDLSSCNLTIIKGLSTYSKLQTLNLTNNKLEGMFDFSKLPAALKNVQLQANNLDGFINLDVSRKFTQLYLPNIALYDLGEIVNYYKANKDVDLQVETNDKLSKYTLLRNVADENLKAELKKLFPTVFTGEQIDLEKSLSEEEMSANIILGSMWAPYANEVTSLDGIQFIVCRDDYKGQIDLHFSAPATISYFKAPKNATNISLKKVTATGVFDFSTSVNAGIVKLSQVLGVKKLDLSNNKALGDASIKGNENSYLGAILCDDLEEVVMPKNWDKLNEVTVSVGAAGLPKLKTLDISKVNKACLNRTNTFGQLSESIKITYPKDYRIRVIDGEKRPATFQVGAKIKDTDDFKAFSEKYKDLLKVDDLNLAFLPFY